MLRKVVISTWLTSILSFCYAQQDTTKKSYAEQFMALEKELDSLFIYNLFDDILSKESIPKSEIGVQFGYTSSVTSSGRDYDIEQSGLIAGISFYKKNGLFVDLSGYWNSDITPNYNPTILTTGYLGSISKKWGYTLDYERWFFSARDSSSNKLTNSFSSALNYDFKIGFANLEYSYLFGQGESHRIIGNISGNINLGKWWLFKRISLLPSVTAIVGNGDITTLRITQQQLSEFTSALIERIDPSSELNERQVNLLTAMVMRAFREGDISTQQRNELTNSLQAGSNLTDEQISTLNALSSDLEEQEFVEENSFGLLNYSFSLPLSLMTKRVSILLNYTYSVPVALPGEVLEVNPVGYFGFSVSYRIPFK